MEFAREVDTGRTADVPSLLGTKITRNKTKQEDSDVVREVAGKCAMTNNRVVKLVSASMGDHSVVWSFDLPSLS